MHQTPKTEYLSFTNINRILMCRETYSVTADQNVPYRGAGMALRSLFSRANTAAPKSHFQSQ